MSHWNELSNEELLKGYQNAEMAAFNVFFSRNRRLVFTYLLARLGHRADAEEAFQETFLKVHRHILAYDPQQNALGWLMAIARNAAIDLAKKRGHQLFALLEEAEDGGSPSPHGAVEAHRELNQCLASLSAMERRIILLRLGEGESFASIAAQEDLPEQTLRKRFSRLLTKLRLTAERP